MKVFKNWKNNFDKGMRSLILYDGDNGSYASGNFKDLYYSTRFVRVAVKNVKEVLYKK
jgi:hypothetical protein